MRRIEFVDGARLVWIDGHINPDGIVLSWTGALGKSDRSKKRNGRESAGQCANRWNHQFKTLNAQRSTGNAQRRITQFSQALVRFRMACGPDYHSSLVGAARCAVRGSRNGGTASLPTAMCTRSEQGCGDNNNSKEAPLFLLTPGTEGG